MSETNKRIHDPDGPTIYQIRIRGHLDQQWADWFDGMAVTTAEDGDTLLTGPAEDQAALLGLIRKVRDLGIPLVSVQPFLPRQADIQTNNGNDQLDG